METSHVVLIIVGCLFVFGMAALFVLMMIKRAAMSAMTTVMDKTISKAGDVMDKTLAKATDMVGQKVIDPTMAVATESVRQGIGAVGQAVKSEYEDSKRRSPANIDIEVTKLAERLKGKVTTADVTSQLKLTSLESKGAFKRLKAAGDCVESPQGHYVIYVFSAFLEQVKVWCCDYCQKKYFEDPGRAECPSCGANLDVRHEARA